MNKYEIRRINLLRLMETHCDGSIKELSIKIGKDQSYVSRLLYEEGRKNKKNIADRATTDIEFAFNLPRGWLDGLSSNNDENTADLIPPKRKQNLTSFNVEVMNITASAGIGYLNSDVQEVVRLIEYNADQAKILFSGLTANNLKVININGDSMQGTFESGDSLFVDVSRTAFEGDGIYVFTFGRSLYVKRLQVIKDIIRVKSDNALYDPWEIHEHEMDQLYIHGKVMLSQSMLLRKHG